ncbi:MAG: alginate lyase family protein [Lentisphaerae bacterium]|nr:alginate lyase family protein [Lentisphaerota bacterium]
MQPTSIEWVCATYPERIGKLFDQLDLDRDGLRAVKAAVARGDKVTACKALLEYYRQGDSGKWLRWAELPKPGTARDEQADAILNDTFTFYLQTDRVPRKPDGGLQWTHRGPSDDWEWTLALNRHHHLRHLLTAYRNTGNGEYAVRIDEHLRDWICASLPYPARANVGDIWRGLETSFRSKAWAHVFYALQQDKHFTPAARLLMLTSLPEHAHHPRNFHAHGYNWATMELSGLGMIAAAWPEYKEADKWLDYASTTLSRELAQQIYPDGAQKELTSGYHRCALINFNQFAEICRCAGMPMPEEYNACLEKMWNYLACTIRPDGHGLLNNDSDLNYTRDFMMGAAETYARPDWAYMTSNGAEGEKPEMGPSFMFPWAGQLVMRSGWDAKALWAFFDLGPWGVAHQHSDKLHLSVSAYGRDLLVDSGRFTYTGKDVRFRQNYALLSRAHNVVIIDGKGQGPGPGQAQQPISEEDYLITPELIFARGTCDHFDALDGKAVHIRVVVYLANKLIVVADRIETDRARHLEALWHWHPRCTVAIDGKTIVSTDAGTGNLRIVPVAGFDWHTQMVKGQEKPHLQGWYSRQYNEWEANPTAVLTAAVEGNVSFAWLLLPALGEVASIRGNIAENTAALIRIRIDVIDGQAFTVSVPWQKGKARVGF